MATNNPLATQTVDNTITNKKVADGSLPASQVENIPQTNPALPEGLDQPTAQRILSNLNEGWNNARGTVYGSREAYNNAYNYANRTTGEKALFDKNWNARMGGQTTDPSVPTPQENIPPVSMNPTPTEDIANKIADTSTEAIKTQNEQAKIVQDEIAQAAKDKAKATEDQKVAEQDAADKITANYNAQIAAQQNYATQYAQMKQEQADKAITVTQPLLDKEKDANTAAIAKAQAEQDAALYDSKIENDVAQQTSAVSFAKLGLGFSGAAINTSQQIFQQGSYNIAKLKADGAYNIANLRLAGSKIEVEHQLAVNKIISDANTDILNKRAEVVNNISGIQNNIILTEKEKKDNIKKLTDDLIDYKVKAQNDIYNNIRVANTDAQSNLATIQTQYEKIKTENKTKADELIASGRIYSLTPAQVQEMEQKSGMVAGTLVSQQASTIYKSISAISGKIPSLVLSPEVSARLYSDVVAKVKMGTPLEQALNDVVLPYLKTTPEYATAIAAQKKTAALEIDKTQAEINKLNAEASKTGAEAKDVSKNTYQPIQIDGEPYSFDKSSGTYVKSNASEASVSGSGLAGVKYNGKTLTVNEKAQKPLISALNELGTNQVFIPQSFRTTAQQQELYDKYKAGTGGLAAAPGTSAHETGNAIDVYSDSSMKSAPSPEQVAILNKWGYEQDAGAGDMGHFTFKGIPKSTKNSLIAGLAEYGASTDEVKKATQYLNNGDVTAYNTLKDSLKKYQESKKAANIFAIGNTSGTGSTVDANGNIITQ